MWVLVDRRPGKIAAIANDIAIDDIADAPENLTGGSEQDTAIECNQWIDTFNLCTPEKHRDGQEERSKEGHSAFPGRQDMLWLL